MPELDLDGVRKCLGVVRSRVNGDECLGRRKVLGVELEHLLVRLCGAIELLLLVGPELRDLEEERIFAASVRLLGFLLFEDANELVPLAGLRVKDFEVVPPSRA